MMNPATLFNAVYTLFSALISDFMAEQDVSSTERAFAHLSHEAARLNEFEQEHPDATMEQKIDCHVRMTAVMMALVYFDCVDSGIVDLVPVSTMRYSNHDRSN